MKKIGRDFKYDQSCYRMGAKPGPNSIKRFYTEYVEYSAARNHYFIRRWDNGLIEFDSEPLSAEGKQLFPNLTRYCPNCHEPLNFTKDHCTNWPFCGRPIDDDNRIRVRTEHNFELADKSSDTAA